MDEQILAGQLVDDAESLGVLGISAGKAIEHKDLLALQVGNHLGADGVIAGLVDGTVDLAPGNLVMHGGGINNEFVVGAAAGVLTGLDHQRAGQGQRALAAAQGVLRQLRGVEIPVNCGSVDDTQFFQSIGFHVRHSSCLQIYKAFTI